MSADKYPSIFSRQMAIIVYIFVFLELSSRKTVSFEEQIMSIIDQTIFRYLSREIGQFHST